MNNLEIIIIISERNKELAVVNGHKSINIDLLVFVNAINF